MKYITLCSKTIQYSSGRNGKMEKFLFGETGHARRLTFRLLQTFRRRPDYLALFAFKRFTAVNK